MIRHLIISGGGYHVFNIFGIMYQLEKKKIYNIENIKSIYCVSAGSIIGSILCLKMDLDDLINYGINRPWEKDIKLEPKDLLNLLNKKGILGTNFIYIIFYKLLLSKNLNPEINLLDFYNYSKIDLHIFSLSCNRIELIDFSHKTHPELKLLDAIHMSSSIPFIFQPLFYNNSYMLDGALLEHFPFERCKENNEEKLGILVKKNYINIEPSGNILNLYTLFFSNFIYYHNSNNYDKYKNKKNILIYQAENFNRELLINLINKKDTRKEEIEKGFKIVDDFLEKK